MKYAIVTMTLLAHACFAANCDAEFEVRDDRIIFMEQGEIIKALTLKPRSTYGDKGGYVEDKVYYNKDYVLIYRDYTHDRIRKVGRIDIYDGHGNRVLTITQNPHWFLGTQFVFAKDWVVIIRDDARGGMHGYAFIHMKDKTVKYQSLHQDGENLIYAFFHPAGIAGEEGRVWIITGRDTWGDTKAITEVDGRGNFTRSYTFAGGYSADSLESDLDLHDVSPGEPKEYTYEERFSYRRALGSVESVGIALMDLDRLVERLRWRSKQDTPSQHVPELDGIESADWETLNLLLPNSLGSIEGTLRKQNYLLKKLAYELAHARNDGSDEDETSLSDAHADYQQAMSEFRHFWENFGIAD